MQIKKQGSSKKNEIYLEGHDLTMGALRREIAAVLKCDVNELDDIEDADREVLVSTDKNVEAIASRLNNNPSAACTLIVSLRTPSTSP